jgi:hypothetical protein
LHISKTENFLSAYYSDYTQKDRHFPTLLGIENVWVNVKADAGVPVSSAVSDPDSVDP